MRDKRALKTRLLDYLKRHPEWHPKGTLCDLARAATNATGEHTGRRLRELETNGLVEVDYRRGHAWYRFHETPTPEEWFAGLADSRSHKIVASP